MKISINKKLLLSFISIILISLLITGITSTLMIDKRFNLYLLEEHKEKIENIKSMIHSAIKKNQVSPDFDKEGLTKYAVAENYIIKITDLNNNIIYTTGMYPHMGHQKNGHMMGPMMERMFKNMFQSYNEDIYPIIYDNKEIGKLTIGYFGTSNISKEAMSFKLTLYKSILISSFMAIIISALISILISRQLGIPIREITKASKAIKEGHLSIRTNIGTNIHEISELSSSINNLAHTLEKQEALRNRLTSDMAHEIRTPLTTIKSHIEAFMDGIWQPTPERLRDCYDEINRLHSLVENLEDINKLDKANYVLNKSYFRIDEELKRIVNSLIPQFNKKNIKLNLNSKVKTEVFMDRDKFKQIMYNLLSNAFKYSHENSIVNISCYTENEYLYIIVQDFGVGISKKDLPHIFEHLYRGDLSRTRSTGGSGIGLTITKNLVQAHGGTIEAKSDIVNGTVFSIKFLLKKIRTKVSDDAF
ncbi:HAMP domain-containing sensor histidine kinase [Paramaledivibacter caminithermalis]|jgi:signal transduction histidine kinase|uniref:histidine kinase n=1 Tax=Paramaledivibacter caminithermalis (strain DSM 15212 / CIP 107654 / DViRD3) TaxID=1121301 RepID=A0A1M6R2D6_PARC5|nr:HAMP domain-containing sensor histidine kinase [Paramaledivibacter caminithermalis]SHK26665.1 Signal transduction histidine kinase [Paramaledivibacter caminithermalis DSM 15212]